MASGRFLIRSRTSPYSGMSGRTLVSSMDDVRRPWGAEGGVA